MQGSRLRVGSGLKWGDRYIETSWVEDEYRLQGKEGSGENQKLFMDLLVTGYKSLISLQNWIDISI